MLFFFFDVLSEITLITPHSKPPGKTTLTPHSKPPGKTTLTPYSKPPGKTTRGGSGQGLKLNNRDDSRKHIRHDLAAINQ